MKSVAYLTAVVTLAASSMAAIIPARDILQVRASADFPNPTVDPFYAAPANLSSYKKGAVIRSRSVSTTINAADVAAAYQLYYRTEDTQGNAAGTVATIWTPKKLASGAPKIGMVSVYEDASAVDCAPSWSFVSGSGSKSPSTSLDVPIYISSMLQSGAYAIAADHEGSQASFIAGHNAGKHNLDGLRALKNFYKLGKDAGTVAVGYSGGGHATVWTTVLAESYAPDVKFLGAVHGGTPTDLLSIITLLNKGPFSGFIGAGLVGVATQYPELKSFITQHLTEAGKQLLAQYTSSGYCLGSVVAGGLAGTDYFGDGKTPSQYFTIADPLSNPIAEKIFAQESLLKNVSSSAVPVVGFPTYQYHAENDEIVPYPAHKQFVDEQCAGGADVQFVTLAGEHLIGEIAGTTGAIQWMQQAFAGTIPKVKCGTATPNAVISPNSMQADKVLGSKLAAQLRGLQGKVSALTGQKIKF